MSKNYQGKINEFSKQLAGKNKFLYLIFVQILWDPENKEKEFAIFL